MNNRSILVTGSLAFDFIMDFPGIFADNIDPTKLHNINLSFLVETLKKERGGTAGNIAYTLALLQSKASILGTVGQDFEGYAKFLIDAGVDTTYIKIIPDEFTSQAFITTDNKDNQISAFYPGAMSHTADLDITNISVKPEYVVISPNHPVAMINFVKQSKQLAIPYMFDPGMQLPRLSDEDLTTGITGADILIGNDYEIGLIKLRLNLTDADLAKKVRLLITTLGKKGAQIIDKDQAIAIAPAKPSQVLDPTGAGDAFRGGFLAGMLANLDLKTCGGMGAIASCFAIEKYGTTNHGYLLEEFCARYQLNFEQKLEMPRER